MEGDLDLDLAPSFRFSRNTTITDLPNTAITDQKKL